MFTTIKWIKGNPYKYVIKSVWDKKHKTSVPVFVKYLGRASEKDVIKYYKGLKYKIKKREGKLNGKKNSMSKM